MCITSHQPHPPNIGNRTFSLSAPCAMAVRALHVLSSVECDERTVGFNKIYDFIDEHFGVIDEQMFFIVSKCWRSSYCEVEGGGSVSSGSSRGSRSRRMKWGRRQNKAAFDAMDLNGDGTIDRHELEQYHLQLLVSPSSHPTPFVSALVMRIWTGKVARH